MATILNHKTVVDIIQQKMNEEIAVLAEEIAEKAAQEYKKKYKEIFIRMASSCIEQNYRVDICEKQLRILIDFQQDQPKNSGD